MRLRRGIVAVGLAVVSIVGLNVQGAQAFFISPGATHFCGAGQVATPPVQGQVQAGSYAYIMPVFGRYNLNGTTSWTYGQWYWSHATIDGYVAGNSGGWTGYNTGEFLSENGGTVTLNTWGWNRVFWLTWAPGLGYEWKYSYANNNRDLWCWAG